MPAPLGLANVASNCWYNSVMQVIANNRQLFELFQQQLPNMEFPELLFALRQYREVQQQYCCDNNDEAKGGESITAPINMRILLQELFGRLPQLGDYGQQADSYEAFISLLGQMKPSKSHSSNNNDLRAHPKRNLLFFRGVRHKYFQKLEEDSVDEEEDSEDDDNNNTDKYKRFTVLDSERNQNKTSNVEDECWHFLLAIPADAQPCVLPTRHSSLSCNHAEEIMVDSLPRVYISRQDGIDFAPLKYAQFQTLCAQLFYNDLAQQEEQQHQQQQHHCSNSSNNGNWKHHESICVTSANSETSANKTNNNNTARFIDARDGRVHRYRAVLETFSFANIPAITVFVVSRFSWCKRQQTRVKNNASFPMPLRFSCYFPDLRQHLRFSLQACISHIGTQAENGHYVAYVKQRCTESATTIRQWYRCNDQQVSPISIAELSEQQVLDFGFMYFYQITAEDPYLLRPALPLLPLSQPSSTSRARRTRLRLAAAAATNVDDYDYDQKRQANNNNNNINNNCVQPFIVPSSHTLVQWLSSQRFCH
jgi:hypothetical protein